MMQQAGWLGAVSAVGRWGEQRQPPRHVILVQLGDSGRTAGAAPATQRAARCSKYGGAVATFMAVPAVSGGSTSCLRCTWDHLQVDVTTSAAGGAQTADLPSKQPKQTPRPKASDTSKHHQRHPPIHWHPRTRVYDTQVSCKAVCSLLEEHPVVARLLEVAAVCGAAWEFHRQVLNAHDLPRRTRMEAWATRAVNRRRRHDLHKCRCYYIMNFVVLLAACVGPSAVATNWRKLNMSERSA